MAQAMTDNFKLQRSDMRGKGSIDENVFAIFNEYLPLGSTVSPAQVASKFAALVPTPTGDAKTLDDGPFFSLWGNVIKIAEQIPYDHPASDKLVKVIRELTLLDNTGITVWETRLWTDLPVLGAAFREYLNGPERSDEEEAQARIDLAWIRFHAFSAKLIGAGVVDFKNQVIWMLRSALEEDKNTAKSSALDRDLTTAAVYIEFAGPILVEALAASPNPVLSDELRRVLRGGSLYKGEPGLRLDRWRFWIGRFREEAGRTKTKGARDIALRAARLMEVWDEKRLGK
ncbi:hypothetical protein M426DRAFT_165790 [Hypoxylon sp. CI-4A]|nr:hypothetical protein M426DRAFT_165790 [Hypoxylon sp. CI-4A]